MRKKLLNFSLIATILFFGACSNEELLPETNQETGRTLSFTASMPDEAPSTRLALESEGKDIKVTWEVGDTIKFAYVQGVDKAKGFATVESVSNNGKTANFVIPINSEATGDFTLYGVYGGGEIDITTGTNPVVTLPTNAGSAGQLGIIQERKDVMLYFEHDMNVSDTKASVVFKHLGSLFNITINNTNNVAGIFLQGNVIKDTRLVGVGGDNLWAYNAIAGGQSFDLVTKTFLNQETAGNFISFDSPNVDVDPVAQTLTVRGWFPMTGKVWPELKLQMRNADGTFIINTTNSKPAKATAPIAGKNYNFYAAFNADQSQLFFTNDQFVVAP